MEEWRETKYFGYEVSSYGNVRSVDRVQTTSSGVQQSYKGRMLKKTIMRGRHGNDGYYVVNLRQCGKSNVVTVHRLVADAFLSNTYQLPTINHKDGNKLNNCVENLEWCSYAQNNIHALANGLRRPRGTPIRQLDFDGNVLCEYKSESEAARVSGVSRNTISHCVNGRSQSAGGYKWEKIEGQSTIESMVD